MRGKTLLTGLFVASILMCAGSPRAISGARAAGGVTLHYWTAATATDPASLWMNAAIAKFEQQHPGDKVVINRYSSAAASFTAFHAASIAGNGPDLVDLWTGLYTLREKAFLVPLNNYLSAAEKAHLVGLDSMATNLDAAHNNFYGVSSLIQTYMGYYNKTLFAKAGLVAPSQTYSGFLNDLATLKKHGIQPIEDGGNPWLVATNFASFMMNTLPASSVDALRTGKIPWTDSRVSSALADYASIYHNYVNPDVLTEQNPSAVFLSGKAAMLWNDGSWNLPQYEKALGKNLGFFFIPQKPGAVSPGDIATGPGEAYCVTKYSKNQALAIDLLKDAISPSVMNVVIKDGAIPAITGIDTSLFPNPLSKQLYNIVVAKSHQNKTWPLWDNYQAPAVDDALNKEFGLVVTGQTTPAAALQTVNSIWQTVPASQKQY